MKITIQADKSVDFLTVKKVMYTVTEAGIAEINFAVIKLPDEIKEPSGDGS
jgi:biopolymer transport protein ExbD